jgi:flagellar motor switch protein FliN/FliY
MNLQSKSQPSTSGFDDMNTDANNTENLARTGNPCAAPFPLAEITPSQHNPISKRFSTVNDLMDEIEVDLRINLGQTTMKLDEFLRLRNGSVITLDQDACEPVSIFANEKLIALGEALVVDQKFSVRVTELIGL